MKKAFKVLDIFSGAGGMSCGFHNNPAFKIVAAIDGEFGKPSSGAGKLGCNATYEANIGINPLNINVLEHSAQEIQKLVKEKFNIDEIDVLVGGPPCTGFSRANPNNHIIDDPRNSLVLRTGELAVRMNAKVIVIENARELIKGNFSYHYHKLKDYLEKHKYKISADIHVLNKFGLPQTRERALIIAVKEPFTLHTIDELWDGLVLSPKASTVRAAFDYLSTYEESDKRVPNIASEIVKKRIKAIPHDGGSWIDLTHDKKKIKLLTKSMLRNYETGNIGSYPDVYGRMKLDRPASTIKRECGHIGNGRYAHPTEDRLCTVGEMAILQGFPADFKFVGKALSNLYRHIGDAVPPLISFQLSQVTKWILTGSKPSENELVLKNTHLKQSDIKRDQ